VSADGTLHPYMDKPPGIPVQDPEGLPFLLQILFDCAVEEANAVIELRY